MAVVQRCELPESALLCAYMERAYVDCFTADIVLPVSLEEFATAFYTTRLFKVERCILKWALFKPSTDEQARQLAVGVVNTFAAWHVENRTRNQLLLSDMNERTRSWLMVLPVVSIDGATTRLYFGSVVVPVRNRQSGKNEMGLIF